MKKLIIFVLTLFLTFTIILSSKNVNAELTPITPVYSGDIFNGKELYLFQNYSATPNFENGYISKQTITNQDVYYQENSYYNGWYKNLGQDLIYEYTADEEVENPYFWFYIPLNGLLAQYFQFALIAPEPFEAEYTIKFRNENPFVFLTANQYNNYLVTPPTNDMTKEIEWFCFEVYFPDYMASFRPLTAQVAYDFGFSAGESVGFNRGHNTGYATGYNNGYTDGYNEGSIDTQYGVNKVVDFNQLVQNPLFEPIWDSVGITDKYVENNTITFLANQSLGRILNTIYMQNSHKYYIKFDYNQPINYERLICVIARENNFIMFPTGATGEYITYQNIFTWNQTTGNATFYLGDRSTSNFNNISIRYPIVFDLTQIYGIGNEPTNFDVIVNDFPSNFYPYTQESLINIDYENGYIKGQKIGYNLGYDDGKDAQATQQLTSTGWINSIFGGISSLLNIQIFPGVTIGIIVGIPFVISLAYFVIRAFRGGGGA